MDEKKLMITSLQGMFKGREVAIKEHKEDMMSGSAFRTEAETMKELVHPNIVRVYGVCTSKPFSIVMEFMQKGSLIDVLRGKKVDRLTETELRKVAFQVSCYCES